MWLGCRLSSTRLHFVPAQCGKPLDAHVQPISLPAPIQSDWSVVKLIFTDGNIDGMVALKESIPLQTCILNEATQTEHSDQKGPKLQEEQVRLD